MKEFEDRLHTALITTPSPEDMQLLFATIDQNGDGRLSCCEVEKTILRERHAHLKPAVVLRAFRMADQNGNEAIDQDEFYTFLRLITYYNNLYSVFTLMDTNGDRRLQKSEFLQAAAILRVENPDQVFEEMDINNLGYLVFDEFCFWMAERQVVATSATTTKPTED